MNTIMAAHMIGGIADGSIYPIPGDAKGVDLRYFDSSGHERVAIYKVTGKRNDVAVNAELYEDQFCSFGFDEDSFDDTLINTGVKRSECGMLGEL